MSSKGGTKLQQARFLAKYLEHGDAPRAYVEAGYEGPPDIGASQLMRRPSVQAWLTQTADAVAGVAIEAVKAQTKSELATREGLSEWLVGVVEGAHEDTIVTKEGPVSVVTAMKDRIAAAKLLAAIQGMLAPIKHEVDHRAAVFHFTTIDNGRGGELPGEIVVDDA